MRAFDGDVHLVDSSEQQRILQDLQVLGVVGLGRALVTDEADRIVAQYRAMKREIAWDRWKKIADALDAEFSTPLEFVPPNIQRQAKQFFDAIYDFVGPVANPYPGYDGAPKDRARARRRLYPRARPASHPSTLDGVKRFVAATQQGFMPTVRRAVYHRIEPAVRRQEEERLEKRYPSASPTERASEARRMAAPKACRLTSVFIRAFYPTFGKTTTPESVRKAVAVAGKRGRRVVV